MIWKIDEKTAVPPFIMVAGEEKGTHELNIIHGESGAPWDFPVTLSILKRNPNVALISATDRRGTTDGSLPYKKLMCYSFGGERQIITTYQVYTFTGPVVVKAWRPENRELLRNIDMEHLDITPDRTPERLIERHLKRIAGRNMVVDGLGEMAEKTYFDMLWNVSSAYLIYTGSVPELPSPEESVSVV